jgi:cell wall assembly regulator SMI1
LLSITESIRERKQINKLDDEGNFKDLFSQPDPGVTSKWWNRDWLPIATNDGGDFVCVDMSPTKNGVIGQVIIFYHDMNDRPVIATSLGELFELIADGLESGEYIVDEENGIAVV